MKKKWIFWKLIAAAFLMSAVTLALCFFDARNCITSSFRFNLNSELRVEVLNFIPYNRTRLGFLYPNSFDELKGSSKIIYFLPRRIQLLFLEISLFSDSKLMANLLAHQHTFHANKKYYKGLDNASKLICGKEVANLKVDDFKNLSKSDKHMIRDRQNTAQALLDFLTFEARLLFED
jgi:hypothetical protein